MGQQASRPNGPDADVAALGPQESCTPAAFFRDFGSRARVPAVSREDLNEIATQYVEGANSGAASAHTHIHSQGLARPRFVGRIADGARSSTASTPTAS